MSDSWRLIPYQVHDAATNMAIDEAILEAHLHGKVPPTLRVYGWKPRAVSIGYGQRLSESIERRIRDRGFDIVRRPTGGRAVVHAHELTYSFVGSAGTESQGALSDSVIKAYKQICEGLILAFQTLGVTLALGESSSQYKNAHDCFLATTSADLHHDGKKMIGSAQLRRRHGVLQHGSILLDQPQDLMMDLLFGKIETEAKETYSRHRNLFDVLGRTICFSELESALRTGFEIAFHHTILPSGLIQSETSSSKELRRSYESPLSVHKV
ncbi:MAG: lipoate--protein ligase family protein [Candidatus Obscuribacterales bacterium]|nr:lipoate--protein ligase family protein [Candidatus Obscuribacterales bacterium]